MANFNKGREIDLIKYVPDVLADVDEYKAIMTLETQRKKEQWAVLEKLFDSQYILEAGEFGISLFEKMHEITKLDTETLQYRRNRVYQLYNDKPPFTRRWLKTSLDTLLAETKFSYDIDTEKFTFRICFEGIDMHTLQQVSDWLEKILPYNMLISKICLQRTGLNVHVGTFLRSTKTIKVGLANQFDVDIEQSRYYAGAYCRKYRIKHIGISNG